MLIIIRNAYCNQKYDLYDSNQNLFAARNITFEQAVGLKTAIESMTNKTNEEKEVVQ